MSLARRLRALRRGVYGLRAFIPGLRRRHRLEAMVGPLGCWDELQAYQLNTLRALGLQPAHTVLDIGCGPLQGGTAFIAFLDAGRYLGVDILADRVAVAHEEITRHGLAAKDPRVWVSGSFGDHELAPDRTIDWFWLSQILYYFDDAAFQRLFEMASRRLTPAGAIAGDIVTPTASAQYHHAPGFRVRRCEEIAALAGPFGLRVEDCGPIVRFGYPAALGLRNNTLLRITRRS